MIEKATDSSIYFQTREELEVRSTVPIIVRSLSFLLLIHAYCLADTVGSIFVTGHDPDFHGQDSIGLAHGAANLFQAGMNYVRNGRSGKFLVIGGLPGCLTNDCAPAGHLNPVVTLNEMGFTMGTDFDIAPTSADISAADLSAYAFVVVESDFGGLLTADALHGLFLRSSDIASYLNSGGGVMAMAESGSGAFATNPAERFGFLPNVISSATLDQAESGFALTSFGASLGLNAADINGNFSHNIFTDTGGLNVVDRDSAGHIITLAGRVSSASAVPEPAAGSLVLAMMLAGLLLWHRHRATVFRCESPNRGSEPLFPRHTD
jgi:hypothetical protein